MIDIDHFKKVNDTYGHHCGDLVLRQTAQIIEKQFRSSDIVARLGGEEFCVLAIQMDPMKSHALFDSLRQQVAQNTIIFNNTEIQVTISIGLTTIIEKSLDDMLQTADRNLYLAKRQGRNTTVGA